jgi:glycosyltransferase involved in cell wall biosynthesis
MINVLFMQSQTYFGSDSMMHALIMGHLDRSRVTVHVAVNPGDTGTPSPALEALQRVPDLLIQPVNFGPSVSARQHRQVARDAVKDGGGMLADLARLLKYARKHHIDLVHGSEKPRDALYGFLVARLSGARAITHVHVQAGDWMSPLARWPMQHDDALIAVSPAVLDRAVESGYRREKVWSVLNAIDASQWDPGTNGTPIRQEFGISAEVPVISVISRLFPWKGHDLLLEALAKVKADGQAFKLLIVGEDDPRATVGGGSYLARLRPKVVDLQLHDDVIFTGLRYDIQTILAATDIYAMPSFEEPCAVVYLEAMAMRTPVVALHSGGTPELVHHGRAGLLSEPDDVSGLAANLSRLLADPAERQRMGTYGRSRVETYFTPQRLADDVEDVYRQVLAPPSARELAAAEARTSRSSVLCNP